ncbi:unnamed protein product [Ophioblennius macclurei]
MSDVGLSNGSPPLDRPEPRVPEHPKPSACRNLFGSVDHEELKRELKGQLLELEEAASAKWGFDFGNFTPLANGRLDWELVDCKDVPDFYSRQPRREKGVCPAGNNNVDLNGNHNCVAVGTPGEDAERSEGPMECTEKCTGLRKRPACHDLSAQNKRSHTSSDEISCPSRSHSAEHTPRKSSPKRPT